MKNLKSLYTTPNMFVLLFSVALLSLAGCGGGGGGGNGGVVADPGNGGDDTPIISGTTISAGEKHTCAIHNTAAEGEAEVLAAQCWGNNGSGRLGIGGAVDSSTPKKVTNLDSGVTAISAGERHTCAIVDDAAWCWGFGSNGRLGFTASPDRKIPGALSSPLNNLVTAISAADRHTCAIVNKAAYCWGQFTDGRLGTAATADQTVPVLVGTTADKLNSDVTAISAGANHTCAVHKGAAKCWGDDTEGQLGDGDDDSSGFTPVQVTDLTSKVDAISAGVEHTCAVHDGAAKCWGNNENGKLGNSETTTVGVVGIDKDKTTPVQVTDLTSGVTAISAGEFHTCAIHGGAAKCWGSNSFGQLGVAKSSTPGFVSNEPVTVVQTPAGTDSDGNPTDAVLLDSDVTAISAGINYTCAIHSGVFKCWGENTNGRLGVGELPDGDDADSDADTSTSTPQTVSFEE